MTYSVNGVITYIGATETIKTQKGSDFEKREFWIAPIAYDENNGTAIPRDAKNSIVFDCKSYQCKKLDDYKVGDTVTVTFDILGRTFARKNGDMACINSLDMKSIWPAKNVIVKNQPGGVAPAADFNASEYVRQQTRVQESVPETPPQQVVPSEDIPF